MASPSPPDLAEPGDTLSGAYTLAKLASEALGKPSRPSGWAVHLIVPPKEIKDKEEDGGTGKPTEDTGDDDDPASEAALAKAVRALRIEQLGKLAAAIKKLQPPPPPATGAPVAAPVAASAPAAAAEGGGGGGAPKPEELARLRARYDAMLEGVRAECVAAAAHEQRLELAASQLGHREMWTDRTDPEALLALVGVADDVCDLIDQSSLGKPRSSPAALTGPVPWAAAHNSLRQSPHCAPCRGWWAAKVAHALCSAGTLIFATLTCAYLCVPLRTCA